MLVLLKGLRFSFFSACNRDSENLIFQEARLHGMGSTLLTAKRKCILIFPGNAMLLRHILSRFSHGIDPIHSLHLRIHETPSNGGVVNFSMSRKRSAGLGHDQGGATHALYTSRYGQVELTRHDSPGSTGNGF